MKAQGARRGVGVVFASCMNNVVASRRLLGVVCTTNVSGCVFAFAGRDPLRTTPGRLLAPQPLRDTLLTRPVHALCSRPLLRAPSPRLELARPRRHPGEQRSGPTPWMCPAPPPAGRHSSAPDQPRAPTRVASPAAGSGEPPAWAPAYPSEGSPPPPPIAPAARVPAGARPPVGCPPTATPQGGGAGARGAPRRRRAVPPPPPRATPPPPWPRGGGAGVTAGGRPRVGGRRRAPSTTAHT